MLNYIFVSHPSFTCRAKLISQRCFNWSESNKLLNIDCYDWKLPGQNKAGIFVYIERYNMFNFVKSFRGSSVRESKLKTLL